ncbi:hypothetical protein ACOKM5_07480 [Streptomyces sp. BH097]|uniref:hypothetical protein n=1 Tax=unclassified Streptomyces TaxID=2593676 RepID=UPI003BB4A1E6
MRRRARTLTALAVTALGTGLVTAPAPAATAPATTVVAAPGASTGTPEARVGVDAQGAPTLRIGRDGREVLRPSAMGLTTTTSNWGDDFTGPTGRELAMICVQTVTGWGVDLPAQPCPWL